MIVPPDDRVQPWPFMADIQADLTVAIFAMPQAMAFAVLAGLPPVQGLYAAIVA
jgi:MFS superfamily sulfate permease-like transporter